VTLRADIISNSLGKIADELKSEMGKLCPTMKSTMKHSSILDAFEDKRKVDGYGKMEDQNDPVTMILRLKDLRKCAHDWKTYQSEATPGRIVIPSEVTIRDTRQIPFEVDPPKHGSYRDLLEPWFKRPLEATYREKLSAQISALVEEALAHEEIEVVESFSLPLQSRALTLLLNIPYVESSTWISWGTHVFRSEGQTLDGAKASILYDYISEQIDKAERSPGDDLYSVLLRSKVDGQKLTRDEVKGIVVLTFAGGRDTVINLVTNTIAYFAEHPQALKRLREHPEIITMAVEELIRYFSPLTQMGRVATRDAEVCGHSIKADSRISLCWASANRDLSAFENPNEIILDRKINPHVSFGFSHHNCLGATHTRQIMKILLEKLSLKVGSINILTATENIENLGEFRRKVGFHKLRVRFGAVRVF
jgi:cytochrome P450